MRLNLHAGLFGAATTLLAASPAGAQGTVHRQPPPAVPYAGPAPCVPNCRVGFMCHQGQCVSACNPPCPSNLVCVGPGQCVVPGSEPPPPIASGEIHEPPPPPRKNFTKRTHTALGFHLGFSGEADIAGTKFDPEPTLGANFRQDVPVHRYVLLGPLFNFGAWRPEVVGQAPDRNFYVDIDIFIRARIPFEFEPEGMHFYAGMPVGFTLSILGTDASGGLADIGPGWNIGVLFGTAVFFSKTFGLFAEAGWVQHKIKHNFDPGRGDIHLVLRQGVFNTGFVFGG